MISTTSIIDIIIMFNKITSRGGGKESSKESEKEKKKVNEGLRNKYSLYYLSLKAPPPPQSIFPLAKGLVAYRSEKNYNLP